LNLEVEVFIYPGTLCVWYLNFCIFVDGWGQVRLFLRSKYDLAEQQAIFAIMVAWWGWEHVARMGKGEMRTGFWWENLGETDQWEDPDVDRKIIVR
jgi:hypothetical protein